MNRPAWFALYRPYHALESASVLLDRCGLAPHRAARRAPRCVPMSAEHGCAPTPPVPDQVVDRRSVIMVSQLTTEAGCGWTCNVRH
jgi:hypothetical protein